MDVPSELLRAARVALGLEQRALAKASGIGWRTIQRLELNDETASLKSRRRLQIAFEQAGVAFIPDNGPGLRVRRDLLDAGSFLRF